MIFFKLTTEDGKVYSNFEDLPHVEQYLGQDTNNKRNIIRSFRGGEVHLIATDSDAKLFGRNKIATLAIETYARLIPLLREVENRQRTQYTVLAHNLVTTHSRLQDSVGLILSEEKLARAEDHLSQILIAKNAIQLNPESVAESVLDIAKRIVDLQAQLEGFKMLSGNAKLDIGLHNIKLVLQNIIHPYYEELADNQVGIKWHIDDTVAEENRIRTDYKILNIALHHLLNNAVKYTKPYSSLGIFFDPEKQQIKLSMVSIRIEKDEIENIFKLQYCGKNVPPEMAGEGVGMYMVKQAIELLGGKIFIQPDYSAKIEDINGIRYTPNNFVIQLPKCKN